MEDGTAQVVRVPERDQLAEPGVELPADDVGVAGRNLGQRCVRALQLNRAMRARLAETDGDRARRRDVAQQLLRARAGEEKRDTASVGRDAAADAARDRRAQRL